MLRNGGGSQDVRSRPDALRGPATPLPKQTADCAAALELEGSSHTRELAHPSRGIAGVAVVFGQHGGGDPLLVAVEVDQQSGFDGGEILRSIVNQGL